MSSEAVYPLWPVELLRSTTSTAICRRLKQSSKKCVAQGSTTSSSAVTCSPVRRCAKRSRLCTALDVPVQFIRGNCEVAVLAQIVGPEPAWYSSVPADAKAIIRWQSQQIAPALQQLLTGWPMTCQLEVIGLGEVLFCHATPRHENELFTRLTPDDRLLPVFVGLGVPLVIRGHTHMQFDRTIGKTRDVTLQNSAARFRRSSGKIRSSPEAWPTFGSSSSGASKRANDIQKRIDRWSAWTPAHRTQINRTAR